MIWGYQAQEYKDFELMIADDGSGEETRELIETFKKDSELTIRHQWHEDSGFRKCTIMNAAIREASGQYLVFSDGDCIPRSDFLAQHVNYREKGFFLSGGYSKLNMEGSLSISREQIASGEAFDPEFSPELWTREKVEFQTLCPRQMGDCYECSHSNQTNLERA